MTGENDKEGYKDRKATSKQRQLSGEIGLGRRLIDKREQTMCVLHDLFSCVLRRFRDRGFTQDSSSLSSQAAILVWLTDSQPKKPSGPYHPLTDGSTTYLLLLCPHSEDFIVLNAPVLG